MISNRLCGSFARISQTTAAIPPTARARTANVMGSKLAILFLLPEIHCSALHNHNAALPLIWHDHCRYSSGILHLVYKISADLPCNWRKPTIVLRYSRVFRVAQKSSCGAALSRREDHGQTRRLESDQGIRTSGVNAKPEGAGSLTPHPTAGRASAYEHRALISPPPNWARLGRGKPRFGGRQS